MANPYIGVKILGCSSPTIGADKSTYTGIFDTLAQAVDLHDHTVNKGNPITTAALADGAVTTVKIGNLQVTSGKLASDSVTTAKILDANVTGSKIASNSVSISKLANSNRSSVSTINQSFINPVGVDTGLSCTITSVAGVEMYIQFQGGGFIDISGSGTAGFQIVRETLNISNVVIATDYLEPTAMSVGTHPAGGLSISDISIAPATIYRYKLGTTMFSGTVNFVNISMFVTERR